MKCEVCETDIPRGQKYKSPRYTNHHFCCEDCYIKFLKLKKIHYTPKKFNTNQVDLDKVEVVVNDKSDRKKLTDYIDNLYSYDPNWKYLSKQIENISAEYGLAYSQMLGVIRYAVEYENDAFNEEYGLGQYFPKYIEPSQRFTQAILSNIKIAQTLEEDPVIKINNKTRTKKYWKGDTEF